MWPSLLLLLHLSACSLGAVLRRSPTSIQLKITKHLDLIIEMSRLDMKGMEPESLIEYVKEPVNEFMVKELAARAPHLITPMIEHTLACFPDFLPSATMLALAEPHITDVMYVELQMHLPADGISPDEYLYGLGQSAFVGLCSEAERARAEGPYMERAEIAGRFFLLPDIEAVLGAWEQGFQCSNAIGYEEDLILTHFPNWLVAIFRDDIYAGPNSRGANKLIEAVRSHVLDRLAEPCVARRLTRFIHKRLVSRRRRRAWWTLLGGLYRSPLAFKGAFVVVAASAKVEEAVLEELIATASPPLAPESIEQLKWLSTISAL